MVAEILSRWIVLPTASLRSLLLLHIVQNVLLHVFFQTPLDFVGLVDAFPNQFIDLVDHSFSLLSTQWLIVTDLPSI